MAAPSETLPATAQTSKTIAIALAMGDRADFSTQGIVAFGDETSTGSVASWKLDDEAFTTIKAILGPGHLVSRIDIGPAYVEDLAHAFGYKEIAASLKSALPPSAPQVDEIILVRRLGVNDQIGRPAPSLGVFIGQRNPLGLGRKIEVTIFGAVDAIDGKTLQPLAQKNFLSDHCPVSLLGIGPSECSAGAELDSTFAIDRWSSLTPQQLDAIRGMVVEQLEYSLRYTLAHMHLN